MTYAPANPVVWTEIPVRDIEKGIAFYNAAFGYGMKRDDSGPNPMAVLPANGGGGVAGHLYPGEPAKPGSGPTIHLAVPDTLEDTAQRFERAGGTIRSDPMPLPMGRFLYAQDPDGNSIGLFEPKAA